MCVGISEVTGVSVGGVGVDGVGADDVGVLVVVVVCVSGVNCLVDDRGGGSGVYAVIVGTDVAVDDVVMRVMGSRCVVVVSVR